MSLRNTIDRLMDRCAENRLEGFTGFIDQASQRQSTLVKNDYTFIEEEDTLIYDISPSSVTAGYFEELESREFRQLVVSAVDEVSELYDPELIQVRDLDELYSIEGIVDDGDRVLTPSGRTYMTDKEPVRNYMVFSAVESHLEDLKFFEDCF